MHASRAVRHGPARERPALARSGPAPQPALRAHLERASVAALERAGHQRAWQTPAPEVDAVRAQPGRPLLGVLSPRSGHRPKHTQPCGRPPAGTCLAPSTAGTFSAAAPSSGPSRNSGSWHQPRHTSDSRRPSFATSSKNAFHPSFAPVSQNARRNSLARQNDPICAPQLRTHTGPTSRPERRECACSLNVLRY